jgi:type II secretory pathway pseudopilin PulG
MSQHQRSGLTLVEIGVVVAIIGVLMGLLLLAVQYAREIARKSSCLNNLHQIAIACQSHESGAGQLPLLFNGTFQKRPRNAGEEFEFFSWRVPLLPHTDQNELFAKLDFSTHPTDSTNVVHLSQSIGIWICPSTPSMTNVRYPSIVYRSDVGPLGRNDYEAVVGAATRIRGRRSSLDFEGVVWGAWGSAKYDLAIGDLIDLRRGRLKDITDGISQTILIGERSGRPQPFAFGKPDPDHASSSLQGAPWGVSTHLPWMMLGEGASLNATNFSGLYSFHGGCVHFAFADGSTRTLPNSTDEKSLFGMVSSSGGEVITIE